MLKAIENNSHVSFMGEDLSITIYCLLYAQRLVIIPNVVYNYRLGGGTSKYNSEFMNDFIKLYHYKRNIALSNPMPQDWQYYMDVEIINVTKGYIQSVILNKRICFADKMKIIYNTCIENTVQTAAKNIKQKGKENNYVCNILDMDIDAVYNYNKAVLNQCRFKRFIKQIANKL